jgi:hypothetical protein
MRDIGRGGAQTNTVARSSERFWCGHLWPPTGKVARLKYGKIYGWPGLAWTVRVA